MKNGQLRSESDRIVSLILLVCMTIIAAGCVMGVIYLQEYNFYKQDNKGQTAKSIAVQIYSVDDSESAKDYYLCRIGEESEYRLDYYENKFTRKNSNFVFTVKNVLGEVLFDSLNPDGQGKETLTFQQAKQAAEYTGESDFYFFDSDGDFIPLKIDYVILAPELQVTNDRYTSAFQWIDIAYTLRYFVFVATIPLPSFAVAVMVTKPLVTGVTRPFWSTIAISVLFIDHSTSLLVA